MSKRILIFGSGLLGCELNDMFLKGGKYKSIVTMRSKSTESNIMLNKLKKGLNKHLYLTHKGVVCDGLLEYDFLLRDYNPDCVIITIPLPSTELLNLILRSQVKHQKDVLQEGSNYRVIYISSPASDTAKFSSDLSNINEYAKIKFEHETLINKHNQIALQIGFIPELSSFNNNIIPSGLSMKTMLMCNLLTGEYDSDINKLNDEEMKIMKNYISQFNTKSGFVVTPIKNIFNFCCKVIEMDYPKELLGRTLALHSSQIWYRYCIIEALKNKDYVNSNVKFYGHEEENKITNPVKEFNKYFPELQLTNNDVLNALNKSADIFKENKDQALKIILEYAKNEIMQKSNQSFL